MYTIYYGALKKKIRLITMERNEVKLNIKNHKYPTSMKKKNIFCIHNQKWKHYC